MTEDSLPQTEGCLTRSPSHMFESSNLNNQGCVSEGVMGERRTGGQRLQASGTAQRMSLGRGCTLRPARTCTLATRSTRRFSNTARLGESPALTCLINTGVLILKLFYLGKIKGLLLSLCLCSIFLLPLKACVAELGWRGAESCFWVSLLFLFSTSYLEHL